MKNIFRMSDNKPIQRVNNSFKKVAGLQLFWINDLIERAHTIKMDCYNRVKHDCKNLSDLLESDRPTGFIRKDSLPGDVKKAEFNHMAEIVLSRMKEGGIEHLQLNLNHDRNTQIICQAYHIGLISNFDMPIEIRDSYNENGLFGILVTPELAESEKEPQNPLSLYKLSETIS